MKKVILTGLRANNVLHFGNYFGAMLPIVEMAQRHSNKYQINLFVPDLHSFTTPIDHSYLQSNIMRTLRMFVATGLPLNKDNVHIYRQSYVPAHSELAWILSCFTGFGELGRMTEFKDKSSRLGSEHIGVGQYIYPTLQAADILLYDATFIPVGDDQRQHIEFARNIAQRMNSKFGELFTVPASMKEMLEFFNSKKRLRLMDIADPTKKMSKSDDVGNGVVFLTDEPDAAIKKIMAATTDSLSAIQYDIKTQPGVSNLLQILALSKGESLDEIIKKYRGNKQYGQLKSDTAESVALFLQNYQSNLKKVSDEQILTKLLTSEKTMNLQANEKLLRVQRAVGLRV